MKKRPKPFNFTPAQLEMIRQSVRDGCVQPALFKESLLLKIINRFREDGPHHLPPSARAAAWKRAARHIEKARQALAIADPQGWLDNIRQYAEGSQPTGSPPSYSFSAELAWWQRFAEGTPADDPRHPRLIFFQEILDCWAEAGGWLRFSRAAPDAKEPGRLGGPAIRYLQAVSGAVMGAAAPSPEGLRKILERYVLFFEEILGVDGEFAASMEAVRNPQEKETGGDDPLRKSRARRRRPRPADRAKARLLARGPQQRISR
jgi:hypothetical protein